MTTGSTGWTRPGSRAAHRRLSSAKRPRLGRTKRIPPTPAGRQASGSRALAQALAQPVTSCHPHPRHPRKRRKTLREATNLAVMATQRAPERRASSSVVTDGRADVEPVLRFVGRRAKRSDAPARLTGNTRFTADLSMPGLLHARLVLSPLAAARITSIDVAAARAVPGVVGVYTARDLPLADVAKSTGDRSVLLALDRVLYVGHPVAVVLAETESAAEDGASEVLVEY